MSWMDFFFLSEVHDNLTRCDIVKVAVFEMSHAVVVLSLTADCYGVTLFFLSFFLVSFVV